MITKLVWRDDARPDIGALCRWKDAKGHRWEYGYRVLMDRHQHAWTFSNTSGGAPSTWRLSRPNILEVAVVDMRSEWEPARGGKTGERETE